VLSRALSGAAAAAAGAAAYQVGSSSWNGDSGTSTSTAWQQPPLLHISRSRSMASPRSLG
jgi:hypothetical protein